MLIRVRNTLQDNVPKTFLTHTESAGATALRWQNPSGFNASWAIQIGESGEEQTEVRLLGTAVVAGTAGTVTAATSYEHPANTPIYAIKYDQVVFQKSATGTSGTATSIADGTITYQADHEFTQFDDTSGATTDAYRTVFRNSVLSTITTQSDWITSAGFDFYSLARIRQRVKDKLWDASFVDDDTIDNWINEWKDEMVNEVISTNEDYALGTTEIAFGTDGLGTVTTADFSQPRRVWVNYSASERFQTIKMNVNDFLPDQVFSTARPYHYWTGDTVFGIKPEEQGGTAHITFYRFGTTMVNDTDTLPQPMRPYTKSFVDYCVAQALYKDQKDASADRRLAVAEVSKTNFLQNLAPRDKTGPTNVDLVESTSGEDASVII